MVENSHQKIAALSRAAADRLAKQYVQRVTELEGVVEALANQAAETRVRHLYVARNATGIPTTVTKEDLQAELTQQMEDLTRLMDELDEARDLARAFPPWAAKFNL